MSGAGLVLVCVVGLLMPSLRRRIAPDVSRP